MKHALPSLLLACTLIAGAEYAGGQETGAERLESKALQHLKEGRGHARAKRYPRALADLQVAVALAERISETNLTLALALHNLAEVHRLHGEPANALQAYRRALRIYAALDHAFAADITQTRITALLSDSEDARRGQENRAQSASAQVSGEQRLNRINKAVERIRQRLQPNDPTESTGSRTASGSIDLAKVEGSFLEPNRRTYAEAVREKVRRGWQYPPSSRNKHEEGTVEIEFSLLSNGEIDSIKVVKSSGFLPLDMESIRSVREAAPFGPVQLPRGEARISLSLLFRYTLPTPEANRFKAQAPGALPSD